MIVINFKNYKTGSEVLKLARKIPKGTIVSVPAVNISEISKKTKLKVYAQHIDYQEKGRNTGFLIPEVVKKAGASGSLLNHSEHPISITDIHKTIIRAKTLGLKVILCTRSLRGMKGILTIKRLKPYAIAFEDPKLIATGKSITKYESNSVSKFAKTLKGTGIIPLCGAGISSQNDHKEALRLGCKGVLVASAVANSKNPGKFFRK